ncbi:MAG: energy-coupling factor transporter transmembrane component T [Lachnospiraceae bacterium]|nr:energy-coupling factor transporter transmembrane component T [Lachnospiraceae bacterium]
MIREITLGQYYPADSIIHKLDPRVKLMGTIFFIISLFLFKNFVGYIVVTIFLISVIKLSKVPFSFMVKGMKAIVFLLMLTVVMNMFMTVGEPLVTLGKLTITKEGLRSAIFMGLRLMYLVIGSSVMTLTTTPNNLTDGMEKLMNPLKKIKVPVHEISMMMSIALSFIPTLVEETDKIMKAQTARCADFESKNLIKRVKSYIPVLVPLFISAFRRANDLAMAMEARCYNGGEGRTKMYPLEYKKRDRIAYAIMLIYLILTVLLPRIIPFDLLVGLLFKA